MKSALLLAALLLCSCTRTVVQYPARLIAPNTFAMQARDFARYMHASYSRSTPYLDLSFNNGGSAAGDLSVSTSFAAERSRTHDDILGCFNPRTGRIVIAVADIHKQLSKDERLTLCHEVGHREDQKLGQEGASAMWIYLASTPAGRMHLTHPAISALLRKEGYLR